MIGVIAQELEEHCPSLVETGSDGIKSVKYSIMYMKCVKALQEALERIEKLEEKVSQSEYESFDEETKGTYTNFTT